MGAGLLLGSARRGIAPHAAALAPSSKGTSDGTAASDGGPTMPDDSKDRSYVVKMALRNALKLIPGLEQKNQRQGRGYRGAQAAAGARRYGL